MQTVEYSAEILQGGNLAVPDVIRAQLASFAHRKINVHIEIFEDDELAKYSFRKVRKLLRPVQGNMSSDILAEREERI